MKRTKVNRTFSKGIAIADACVINTVFPESCKNLTDDSEAEVLRFRNAVDTAVSDLKKLSETNEIFVAHMELVMDPSLEEEVNEKIRNERKNAEWALEEVTEGLVQIFESMEDEYMRERAADMKDISRRLMAVLKGIQMNPFENIRKKVIVVAKDLTPSDTAQMDFDYVSGFITQEGGVTSHVAIMARSLNIPAIVGAEKILELVEDGDTIAMDAGSGKIVVEPDAQTLETFEKARRDYEELCQILLQASEKPSVTMDGRSVKVCANVGSIEDIESALPYHPDGVGLFRTEFLYMHNTNFPSEEEQYEVYKKAAELLEGKELIIRTLDIGGDKELSYFDFGKEDNPFLGYRAIRICLDRKDVFKTQLRALLRAGKYGNIKIMYPMIISVEELDAANALLEECKAELTREGVPFREDMKAGMMMETPASVILADVFAERVAFFSIGTNDLTQYLLAVDRGNKKVAEMYNSFHPAVLRGIKHIIDCGHNAGIPVGMCGEFASDAKAFPILLGLGLDEFSMSAGAMPDIKNHLQHSEFGKMSEKAKEIMGEYRISQITESL